MQTFLPYSDFHLSLWCLDYRRLGKQRVEAFQLIQAITRPDYAWQNSPPTVMWRPYLDALKHYYNVSLRIWIAKGYNNSMKPYYIDESNIVFPSWIGDKRFHSSHRSNLLRKDMIYYYKTCQWTEPDNMLYQWPRYTGNGHEYYLVEIPPKKVKA